MLEQIKSNLFTLHGLITSVIHATLVIGILSSWVFFRVQVMGEDVSISVPSASAMRSHK